jgi:hypothetical protein
LIGPAGTPAAVSRRTHSAAGAACERGLELGRELVAVLEAARVRGEALVGGEVGAGEDLAQARVQRVVADGDRELAVGGAQRLVRRDARVRLPRRPGTTPACQVPRGLVEEPRERAVHERDLDPLAAPVALSRPQGGEHSHRRVQPADHVDERGADLQRAPAGLAGGRS